MTPDQIATLTALAAIIKSIGTWPAISIIALVLFGPWMVLIMFGINLNKRVEAQAKMYENNVQLVEEVLGLTKGYRDQLIWSTQIVDTANNIAQHNLFCPAVRKNTNPEGVKG